MIRVLILLLAVEAAGAIYVMNNATYIPSTILAYQHIRRSENCSKDIFGNYDFVAEGGKTVLDIDHAVLCIAYTPVFMEWFGPIKVECHHYVTLDNEKTCHHNRCFVEYYIEVR